MISVKDVRRVARRARFLETQIPISPISNLRDENQERVESVWGKHEALDRWTIIAVFSAAKRIADCCSTVFGQCVDNRLEEFADADIADSPVHLARWLAGVGGATDQAQERLAYRRMARASGAMPAVVKSIGSDDCSMALLCAIQEAQREELTAIYKEVFSWCAERRTKQKTGERR